MRVPRSTYARRRAIAVFVLVLGVALAWRFLSVGGGHPGSSLARQLLDAPLDPSWRGDGRAVVLAFGGDVHFEGVLGTRLAHRGAGALDGSVASLLGNADLSMANFESALTTDGCPSPQPKQFVFHAPPSAITAFRAAGVTLVTQANNHGEDCGRAGLSEALAIAQHEHYPIIGIGANADQAFRPFRTVIRGQRIAFIAATQVLDADLQSTWTATNSRPGLASAYEEAELLSVVQAERRAADTVVVYLHWGTETQDCPSPPQEPLAQALVKAGADIVVGAHAHVQLGAGYMGSALVDYGLGNLAFYNTSPPETYSGSLVVTATGRHIDHFVWRPAQIEGGLPIPEHGAAAEAARQRWAALRDCTGLTAQSGPSRATRASETRVFSGRLTTLPPSYLPGVAPGTTKPATKITADG